MKVLKKMFVVLLIICTVNLSIPKFTFAEHDPATQQLEIRTTPEEDIPKVKVKRPSVWTWVIVVGLIGGAAVAASASNKGENEAAASAGTGGTDTGDIDYSW